ncbi:MAG TPA: L,D-transpeptidase family protein [Chryseolinea sp.]|nr:L,D-transpeptidase family protein [Chryseolinea sp.]
MFRILLLTTGVLVIYYFIPEESLPSDLKVDKLVVIKSKRILEAYSNGQVIKTYTISLGRNPMGDKQFEGDKRTPEGNYTINDKNTKSGYHKNLGVSYPNSEDIIEAKKESLKPGGEIKIHGLRNGIGFIGKFHRLMDWTAGCIALTDKEVDELYNNVAIGTPIIIRP